MKKSMFLMLFILIASACSPQGRSSDPIQGGNETSDITLNNEKIGEISRVKSSEIEIEKTKERKRATSLLAIPVSPEHNATVFKVSGLADSNQFLLAPRVFVYGTHARALLKDQNNFVSIPFNIALIDGLKDHVFSQDVALANIEIPTSMRVPDYNALKSEIGRLDRKTADEQFSIGALPGCPSRISIVADGKSYDVTPEHIKESDYCEINRPFSVTLKVPEDLAQHILGDSLRNGMVDIFVNYAVMAPVPVSILSAKFDKNKIFEAININLQGSYPPYGQGEVEIAVEKVMKSNRMSIHIQGDYNEQMKLMVDKTIAEFFQPSKPDPEIKSAGKCENMGCLTVKYVKKTHDETFSIEWSQTENMRLEKVIRVGSKLKPINDQLVNMGRDKEIGASHAEIFSNKNRNPNNNPLNVYSVGVTPQRGNVIEFEPSIYTWERRKRDSEYTVSTKVWEECTGRHGWENKCSYTTRHENTYTQEYTGDEAWVNVQWPLGSVQRLTSGIKLYFKFSNGEETTCELQSLEGYNQGRKRVIMIQNTDLCPLFDGDRRVVTDFGFINNIQLDPIKYTAGQKYVTDYNAGWNRYAEVTYSPEILVAGTVKLIGLSLISDFSIK